MTRPVFQESERRFLVSGDGWRPRAGAGREIVQGYLSLETNCTIRVRLEGSSGTLTIKGARQSGTVLRFTYDLPATNSRELLDHFCRDACIHKTRFEVRTELGTWDVDVFKGANEGLVLAEIGAAALAEAPALPEWIGLEITNDHSYANSRLVSKPYREWQVAPPGG